MNFFDLPLDILLNIYSFDNTYKLKFDRCIVNINHFGWICKYNKYNIKDYNKGKIKYFLDYIKEQKKIKLYNKEILRYNEDKSNIIKLHTIFPHGMFRIYHYFDYINYINLHNSNIELTHLNILLKKKLKNISKDDLNNNYETIYFDINIDEYEYLKSIHIRSLNENISKIVKVIYNSKKRFLKKQKEYSIIVETFLKKQKEKEDVIIVKNCLKKKLLSKKEKRIRKRINKYKLYKSNRNKNKSLFKFRGR